jgi:hypothetical protein
MSTTNISSLDKLGVLTSQLPLPPQQPLPSTQEPEQTGFLGSFGVSALKVAEGLETVAGKIQRFARAIFEEVFNCTGHAKALVTDVFSSLERVEAAVGRNSFLDPLASIGRAWNATTDQAPAEVAKEAPAQEAPAQEAARPQPSPESSTARYKTTFLSKIDAIEQKAVRLQDIALKIVVELGARLAALKSFVTIGLNGLKEIGRVFQARPLSSPELDPLFDQISQMFKNIVRRPADDAAKDPAKAV